MSKDTSKEITTTVDSEGTNLHEDDSLNQSATKATHKREKTQKEKKIRTPEEKKRRKKIIRRTIFGILAAAILGLIIYSNIAAKNFVLPVATQTVTRQTVEETFQTGGTVESEESISYFCPAAVKVTDVHVAMGDKVEKNDKLITFDEEAIALEKEKVQLKQQASEGSTNSTNYKNNKLLADLGEARTNLPVLEQQIEDSENYLEILQTRLADKRASLAREGTLLQISLLEWSYDPTSEEYQNLQKLIQYNAYEQANNKEMHEIQKEIEDYQELIAGYKEYRAEMKSQKKSSESTIMDAGAKSQLEATAKTDSILTQESLQSLEQASAGICADFSGVVTEVNILKGDTPMQGAKLITLQSTEKVRVALTLSKYDLERVKIGQKADIIIAGNTYEGTVKKIDGIATKNNNGAAVVGAEIEINNPNEDIYLGVEAKITLHIAKVEDTLAIPYILVNADSDGDFIYTIEDGVVAKRRIKIGISSDDYCEVLEGLSEGEVIISDMNAIYEEGTKVQGVPEESK